MKNTYSLFLFAFALFFLSSTTYGYYFTDVREKIFHELEKQALDPASIKLAVVYNTRNRSQLKEQTNLIDLKKSLAHEFLKSFQVADPVITQIAVENNNIPVDKISQKPSIIKKLSTELENSHILIAEIRSAKRSQEIQIVYDLFDRNGTSLARFKKYYAQSNNNEILVLDTASPLSANSFQGVGRERDIPWLHFSPSAFLNYQTHNISANLWLKDVGTVDLPLKDFRYSFRYKLFQVGTEYYGGVENTSHSAYLSGKFNFLNEDSLNAPFFMTVGLRARYFWTDENLDFLGKGKVFEKNNKDKDALTLYLAMAAKFKNIMEGLTLHAYIDNLKYTLGSELSLPYNLKILADLALYSYKSDTKRLNVDKKSTNYKYGDTDIAIGIRHLTSNTISINFSYRKNTEQLSFGTTINF